jgi:hypothetical protein
MALCDNAAAIALLVTAVLGIAGYIVQNKVSIRAANSVGPGGPPDPLASSLRPPQPVQTIPTRFPLYLHAIAWKLPTDGPPG